MTPRATRRLTVTAYHEAGHAVACVLLRRRFAGVSILREEGGLGRVTQTLSRSIAMRLEAGDHFATLDEAVRQGVILEAGRAAADRFTGRRTRGAGAVADRGADRYTVGDLALLLSHDGWDQVTFSRWVRFRAAALLAVPLHWAMVEGLAAALLAERTLSYRAAREAMARGVQRWADALLEARPSVRSASD